MDNNHVNFWLGMNALNFYSSQKNKVKLREHSNNGAARTTTRKTGKTLAKPIRAGNI